MGDSTQPSAALWEQVWREYDARSRQIPAPQALPPKIRHAAPQGRWGNRVRRLAALCVVGSAAAYAMVPIVSAARVGHALAVGDVELLASRVDWASLRPTLAAAMQDTTAGHGEQAAVFLHGMAADVARGVATPAGLLGLIQGRLPQDAGGFSMIGAVWPLQATLWSVALHAPGETREAMRVTLSLQDPLRLRWQVVGVDIAPRPDAWGG